MTVPTWEVREGDAAVRLPQIPAGSIDAIVTSPDYADQRDHSHGGGVTMNVTRNSSRKQRREAPGRYAEDFLPFLDLMAPLLTESGSLMLNFGIVMRNGEEHPYVDDILAYARSSGWKLLQRMIWHKPNALPLSHEDYLHPKHEYVLWLARSIDVYRGYDADTRTPHSETSQRRIGQQYTQRKDQRYQGRGKRHHLHPDGARPATVFTQAVGGERGIKHSAPMALKTAIHLVCLSCPPDGLVLDPFCGSGTTGVACMRKSRSFIGIDRVDAHCEEARERVRLAAGLLARQVA